MPPVHDEPHIRVLAWDLPSLTYLLHDKVRRLPPSLCMTQYPEDEATVQEWLGVEWMPLHTGQNEPIESFLLRHTRLIPA